MAGSSRWVPTFIIVHLIPQFQERLMLISAYSLPGVKVFFYFGELELALESVGVGVIIQRLAFFVT